MELVAQISSASPISARRAASGIAVCYQCSFESAEACLTCPECNFPLITRSDVSPPGGVRVGDLLKRESLRVGAPPLPGVHSTPRKAQLMAEARKRIRDTARQTAEEVRAAVSETPAKRRPVWGLVSVCCVAVGFGVVAAAVQSVL